MLSRNSLANSKTNALIHHTVTVLASTNVFSEGCQVVTTTGPCLLLPQRQPLGRVEHSIPQDSVSCGMWWFYECQLLSVQFSLCAVTLHLMVLGVLSPDQNPTYSA